MGKLVLVKHFISRHMTLFRVTISSQQGMPLSTSLLHAEFHSQMIVVHAALLALWFQRGVSLLLYLSCATSSQACKDGLCNHTAAGRVSAHLCIPMLGAQYAEHLTCTPHLT